MNIENKFKFEYNKYSLLLIILIVGYVGVVATLIGEEGASSYKLFWVIIYLFLVISFFLTQKNHIRLPEITVMFFGIYILASSSWSVIWKDSIVYSISYFMNILSALVIARLISLKKFLKILLYTLMGITFIGVILTFLGYQNGYFIDPLDRSNVIGIKLIKGLYSHKIYAGLYASIGFILSHLLLNGFQKKIVSSWFIFAVLISGSSLGIIILLSSYIIYRLVKFFEVGSRKPLIIILLLLLTIILLLGKDLYVEILIALGRDPGLTGRTELWDWAIKFFLQSPIFGWGYGGIFSDAINAPANIFNANAYYKAPHFHNGYLQALSELGIVGSSILFFMMIFVFIKSLIFYYSTKNINFILSFIIIVLLMIAATGMNLFMRYNDLSIFLLVYFYLTLSRFFLVKTT